MQDKSLAFIGLGAMGSAMVRNLLREGFRITAQNRTRHRAEALATEGAVVAETPAEAVAGRRAVVTMLTNDAALEAVAFGESGIVLAMDPGSVHISMSTVAPETSRKLAQAHAERGSLFVAAPVFGRPEAAAAKKLWICLSGTEEAKRAAQPYVEALGQSVFDFGEDPGAASVVKLTGNFMLISATEALAEGLALVEKNGIDREYFAQFLGQSIFACPIYQNYGRIIASRAYEPAGFKLELGMKDLRLLRDVANQVTLPMPLADLVHARLLSALAKGRGTMDLTAMELGTAEDGHIDVSKK